MGKKFFLIPAILLSLSFQIFASYAYYQNLDASQFRLAAGTGDVGFIFIYSSIRPIHSDVAGNDMRNSGAVKAFPWHDNCVVAYIPTKEMFAMLLAAKNSGGTIEWLTIASGNPAKGMCDLTGVTWYAYNTFQ